VNDERRRQTLRREHRLRRRGDFLRCYKQGRRRHAALANLHFHARPGAEIRLGITASRKVGNAVVRHRLKRRVREIFRSWSGRWERGGIDVVVHLKPAAAESEFGGLREELERLFENLPVVERVRGPWT